MATGIILSIDSPHSSHFRGSITNTGSLQNFDSTDISALACSIIFDSIRLYPDQTVQMGGTVDSQYFSLLLRDRTYTGGHWTFDGTYADGTLVNRYFDPFSISYSIWASPNNGQPIEYRYREPVRVNVGNYYATFEVPDSSGTYQLKWLYRKDSSSYSHEIVQNFVADQFGYPYQTADFISDATYPQGTSSISGQTGILPDFYQPPSNIGRPGVTGIQGQTGLQGPTGVQGVLGIQGATGAIGSQGQTGIQGSTGIQGNQGLTGFQGIQGNQGDTGVQGQTGIRGGQGEQGPQGDHGTQGDQGPQGSQGDTGIQGDIGSQGDTGIQGETGIQGIVGDTGIQGQTGIQGITGYGFSKAGEVLAGAFSGDPKVSPVLFNTSFLNSNYSVSLTPEGSMMMGGYAISIYDKTNTGFSINMNTNTITGLTSVMWVASPFVNP